MSAAQPARKAACNCWRCLLNGLAAAHRQLEAGRPEVARDIIQSLIAERIRSPKKLAALARGALKCERRK
jgi:hypothetical protein